MKGTFGLPFTKIRVQNIGLHGYSERRANYERVNRYLYKIRIIC